MRLATSCVAGMALLLFTAAAYASSPSPKAAAPTLAKQPTLSIPNPVHIDQGGDTIGSAIPIAALPYSDSGTTAGYVDNLNPPCGFNNPPPAGAPDVFYSFSPAANVSVNVALCGSTYDTELVVYQDNTSTVVGCNDDSCGLQSQLLNLSLLAGHIYYIQVDGYFGANGAYQIAVSENVPCVVTCPPGSILEGEPVCHDNYYDSYNGGCNSNPPVFSPLPNVQGTLTVCGQYGGFLYNGLSYRDTDWYVIHPTCQETITWAARGETDTLIGIINGNAGCPATSFFAYTFGPACTNLSVSATITPGTWWLWAGTQNFGSLAGPCGQDYVATLTQQCPVAVEPSTWGQIKNMYK